MMHKKDDYKDKVTHFGFQNICKDDKQSMVNDVFHSVSSKYDLMNDLMSFGIHRVWKRFLVYHSRIYTGNKVLDLAGGTGDLSMIFSRLVGDSGLVVLSDINISMLTIGRNRLRNLGIFNNVLYVQADAEFLPFSAETFDCIVVSFGLRNFTDQERALCSMYRVLKSGGKLLILDFGKPKSKFLNMVYDFYSFYIIPKIGEVVAKDANSYQYLVESIRMHPDPETIKSMMLRAGFGRVEYFSVTFGIVVLHCAYKH